ncbi:MAG: hypothetical protein ACHQ53_13870, partial [Polyangiales bacterium]
VVGVEACDDGNTTDTDYCSNNCRIKRSCGDSAVQSTAGETCDDGNAMTEVCTYNLKMCTVCDSLCHSVAGATSYCGDSAIDTGHGEQCDDGNAVTEACMYGSKSCQVCNSTCQNAAGATSYCGDSSTDTGHGEQCDDGNTTTEACAYGLKSCTVCNGSCQNAAGATSYCGDGTVDSSAGAGEQCDDGNAVTESCPYGSKGCTVCNSSCKNAAGATSYCGDGVVDAANGEQCEGSSDIRCNPMTCKIACDTVYITYNTTGNVQLTGTTLGLGDGTYPQTGGTLIVGFAAGATGPVAGSGGVAYMRYPIMFTQNISALGNTAKVVTNMVGTSSSCTGASPGTCVPGSSSNRCLLNSGTLSLNVSGAAAGFPNQAVPGACPYGANHGTNNWTPDNQQVAKGSGPGCLEYGTQGTIMCSNTGALGLCGQAGLATGTTNVDDQWDQPGPTMELSSDFKTVRLHGLFGGTRNVQDKFEVPERVNARTFISVDGTEQSRTCEMKPSNCPTPGAY